MANPKLPRPIEPIIAELVSAGFDPKGTMVRAMRDLLTRADKILTDKGEVQAVAPITGRTEGIATTVGNLDSAGVVLAAGADFSRAYANKNTDNISDGTGSPLTGGKRGFNALDANNRLANSFRANPVNVSNTPTSSTTLSNDGISTAIPISAYTSQFPPGSISYNSGSVDPGVFGSAFIYFDDPTFTGGAVSYQFTASASVQTAAEGRSIVGQITTVGGSAKTGGGSSGGTGGKAGGRGFIQG